LAQFLVVTNNPLFC